MGLNAGELNRRVTLQRRTDVVDALGQSKPTWSDVGTYWAAYEPGLGQERAAAGGVAAQAAGLFRLRRNVGTITTQDRIVYNGDVYNIYSIDDRMDRREEWWAYVQTGVNEG